MDSLESMTGLRNRVSLLSCGIIILTLGSYGLFLSTMKFWVCWSLVVFDAIMWYTVQPYWNWVQKSLDQSEKSSNLSDTCRDSAIRLKVGLCIVLIVILFRDQDFSQRQNKILLFTSLSIIIFEGFLKIGVIRKENYVPNQITENLPKISCTSQSFDWNTQTLLIPSAIHVMICVTGAIVLGGRLGNMLCDKLYWRVFSVLAVDFTAEVIHRFDCGNRSLSGPTPQPLPKRPYFANILRVSVEGLLCYSVIVHTSGNPYYVDLNACGVQCQERSRSILMTAAALSGIQATLASAIPLCSCARRIFVGEREK